MTSARASTAAKTLVMTHTSAHRAREILDPSRHRAGVAELGGLDQPIYHRCLSTRRLDQVDSCSRQGDRQHQAREARSGADIGNPARANQLGNLEPRQAVGHVNVERRLGISDARVRVGLCG